MKRSPVAVTGLRKAPAIVVNRADLVHIGGRWYAVADYADAEGTIVVFHLGDDGYTRRAFPVDKIDEWKKGWR